MAREIWNEGRVTGYSAYEMYVKQHLSEDPNTPPATEREWLASSLAMGSSMILKVPNVSQREDSHTYVDVYLPTNSRLAAANTIVGTFFDGDASFSGNWATKVTDYGHLISNTSSSSPNGTLGSTGTIPTQTLADWTDAKKKQLADYMRVYDGLVLQPGTWVDNSNKPPQKDFQANLADPHPRVRLHIRGSVTTNPLILLTGFTIRTVLAGVVGQDTAIDTGSPQDGDFLGPAVFPWAAKIVFSVPSSYVTYFSSGSYRRALKSPTGEASSATSKTIKDTAVIDMQGSKPETFYNSYNSYYSKYTTSSTNPRYAYNVEKFSTLGDAPTDGEAILTVYQKKAIYPPALYGTFVGENGQHYLNPLDIVAPGSIKMFNEQDQATLKAYQDTFPGTTSMNKKSDGTIQILDVNNQLVDVAGLEIIQLANTNGGSTFKRLGENASTRPRVVKIKTGRKSVYALMMSTNISDNLTTNPTQMTITDNPSSTLTLTKTNSNDNLNWATMLSALTEDKGIDMLGTRMKSAKYSLVENAGYLEFGPESNKTRFYISKTEPNPANVPVGSIGMGWGFSEGSVSPTPTPDPSGGVSYNAFGNIEVGNTTIESTSDNDTLTLAAGNNITITPDASGKKVTISSTTSIPTTFSQKRTYVLIGDSYGAGQNMSDTSLNWQNKLIQYLSNDPNYVTAYKSAVSGSGFIGNTSNNNFREQAVSLANGLTEAQRQAVTDVVVIGGRNDYGCNQSVSENKTEDNDFATATARFNSEVRAKFPNARIWLGYVGWVDVARRSEGTWSLASGAGEYAQYAGVYGWSYMANIEYALHVYNTFTSDGLHPNAWGQRRIAKYACTALLGGSIHVRYRTGPHKHTDFIDGDSSKPYFTLASGVSVTYPENSGGITTTLDNETTSFWMNALLFDFATPFDVNHNTNYKTLLTLNTEGDWTVRGGAASATQWFQPCIITHKVNGSNAWTFKTVGFRLSKNDLQFRIYGMNVDGLYGWPDDHNLGPTMQQVSRIYVEQTITYSGPQLSIYT